MDITMYLAQIWGPMMLALGLGFFLSRSYYRRVYRDLEKSPFSLLVFGMVAVAAGVMHVSAHNVYGNALEVIISLLGWGLLLKGLAALAFPTIMDRSGDWALKMRLVPGAGAIVLLLGAYLTWIGYLM